MHFQLKNASISSASTTMRKLRRFVRITASLLPHLIPGKRRLTSQFNQYPYLRSGGSREDQQDLWNLSARATRSLVLFEEF